MMLPFTICHWLMLIFPSQSLSEQLPLLSFAHPTAKAAPFPPHEVQVTHQQLSLLLTLVTAGFRQRQDRLSLRDQGTNPRDGRAHGTGTEKVGKQSYSTQHQQNIKLFIFESIHHGKKPPPVLYSSGWDATGSPKNLW